MASSFGLSERKVLPCPIYSLPSGIRSINHLQSLSPEGFPDQVCKMSSSSSSTSSLSGSTSDAPDGSRRTLTSSFPGQFGSMSPVFNPDGSLKGIYDLEGNFYLPNSEPTRGGSRNSGLLATPALVTASSSRAPPPPSSMRNRARGSSTSRALISSDGGIPQSQGPRQNFPANNRSSGSTEQNRMMSGVLGSPHVFPVLGSSYPAPRGRSQNQVQARNRRSSMTGGPSRSVSAGYNQPLQHQPNASQHRGHRLPLPPIGQPFGDVAGSSSNPTQAAAATATETQSSPAPDPFSMLGLVGVLNGSNPDATTLAIGMDLTDIGLDMTSKEDLFKTFASPWANEPLKDDPNEFTLPQCYNEIQRPTPHRGMFRRFALSTLFYIFYSMPQDEAQLYAADELYDRDWFYHKEVKCWFHRIGEPLVKTDEYEAGTYECFNPGKFEHFQQENILINYEKLEKRPSLPQHRV